MELDLGRDPNDPADAGEAAAVSGRASSLKGGIGGAVVKLHGASGWVYHSAKTDIVGRYTFPLVRAGCYRIKVEADGFADKWFESAEQPEDALAYNIAAASNVAAPDFTIEPGQTPALVEVTSDLPGAEIYLDFHPTGEVTPAVIDVGEVGEYDARGNCVMPHVITLKRAGSPRPVPRTITPVEADTIVEHFDLEGGDSGAIFVETTPAGAEVFVDYADEPCGVTPLLVENLTCGEHVVLLRKDGYLRPCPVTAGVVAAGTLGETSKPVVYTSPVCSINIPLTQVGAGPEIGADVVSLFVTDMTVYVDNLPTEHETDSAVTGLDYAAYSGGSGETIWNAAPHTILLRKPGVRPFAPRYVDGNTPNVVQPVVAAPWIDLISLAEALDTKGAEKAPVWLETSRWFGICQVDGNREDAAVSSPIGHNTASWLIMCVTNSGTLTFKWRTSCQPQRDYLLLAVDEAPAGRLYGESGWITKTITIEGEGAHEVVWNYIKDGSISEGRDCAWVDRVVWTPGPVLTLEAALDATNLVWQTWGDAPWVPITSTSLDGQDCARSGQIGDSGVSALTTTTTGPGIMQFAWRSSCEMFGDWFDFVVDGVVSDALTGESAWKYVDVELGTGVHTLSWEYWKNESGVAAADTVWLDCVVWTPYGSTVTDTTPVPVPYAWLDGYPTLLASCGGDYEAAALLETGKRDSGGSSLAVWQDYVAGTCPTSAVSLFRCFIEMGEGTPVLGWKPDLGNERVYTIWGKPDLASPWTTPINTASRIFRISVSLP